jgi:hypothetical protein
MTCSAMFENSDATFVREWNDEIDMYGRIFSGITLSLTTTDALPRMSGRRRTNSRWPADSCSRLPNRRICRCHRSLQFPLSARRVPQTAIFELRRRMA